MKNFFSQKSFSQKFLLLFVLLFTFSGCEVDFRDRYSFNDGGGVTPSPEPDPEPDPDPFISYFRDEKEYGVYTYDEESQSLNIEINKVIYTYNHDGDNGDYIGTFSYGIYTVTATVNAITGEIIITDIPFIDYFLDDKTYYFVLGDSSIGYTYSSIDNSLIHADNRTKYTYNHDGDAGGYIGTFGYTVTAKVDTSSRETAITDIPFIDHLKDAMEYDASGNDGDYTVKYSSNEKAFEFEGKYYTFNEESVLKSGDTITGTFCEVDKHAIYGVSWIAKVNTSTGGVTVSYLHIHMTFTFNGIGYYYSYLNGNIYRGSDNELIDDGVSIGSYNYTAYLYVDDEDNFPKPDDAKEFINNGSQVAYDRYYDTDEERDLSLTGSIYMGNLYITSTIGGKLIFDVSITSGYAVFITGTIATGNIDIGSYVGDDTIFHIYFKKL